MKIAVIAASGRTGRVFVDAALAAGHEVIAGVHQRNPFREQPRLKVVTADATSYDDLLRLISGCDAVASLIGHSKGSASDVQTVATQHILRAMHVAHIQRFVSLTGSGARVPGDTVTFLDWLLNASVRIVDPARVQDGINHLALLQTSSLDWTVLRVLKLTDGRPQQYTLSLHGPAMTFVSRAMVAQAAVSVLEQNSFVRKAPIITPKY